MLFFAGAKNMWVGETGATQGNETALNGGNTSLCIRIYRTYKAKSETSGKLSTLIPISKM